MQKVGSPSHYQNLQDRETDELILVNLTSPYQQQIQELIQLVLKEGKFTFDRKVSMEKLIEHAQGLSYYSIQKTLINAVKRSLFAMKDTRTLKPKINTQIWQDLLIQEKEALAIK
ncbi:hypothetical protein [Sphingobacterium sp. SGR-19]|uniref:hypothetical protein n=1 Tax=Sphingobacterium sp. SGR-19 TaxID=2710886 RepID=UPI0013EA91A3|nr:hypothetical protein [Sphingobacterium sp. SGR-19]NGM66842.1 hypothetical protein [Sphingobacterium sp. SGR-19]